MKWFRKIKLRLPRKFETILIVLMTLSLFLLDINQNKIQDFGLDYQVHFASNLLIKATTLFYVGFFVLFILLSTLIFYSIFNKKGNAKADFLIGIIGYLGLIFLFGFGLISFYYPATFQVPFFATTLAQIDGYHFVGIFLLILTIIYFSFTE